eukprot:scaffold5770_cov388-Prasinococcus_capsulatus_cf.AAC.3
MRRDGTLESTDCREQLIDKATQGPQVCAARGCLALQNLRGNVLGCTWLPRAHGELICTTWREGQSCGNVPQALTYKGVLPPKQIPVLSITRALRGFIEILGAAKIAELEVASGRKEQVLGLQVPMYDALGFEELQGLNHLRRVESCVLSVIARVPANLLPKLATDRPGIQSERRATNLKLGAVLPTPGTAPGP